MNNEEILMLPALAGSPKVIMDPSCGEILISGESTLGHARNFYKPIIKWLRSYIKNPQPVTLVRIRLLDFNIASLEMIMYMLEMLETLHRPQRSVLVQWHYDSTDDKAGIVADLLMPRLKLRMEKTEDPSMSNALALSEDKIKRKHTKTKADKSIKT